MSHFKAKMHQIQFQLELRPQTSLGNFQRSPDPLAGFKGPTSKEREGNGWEWEGKREGDKRKGEEKERRRGEGREGEKGKGAYRDKGRPNQNPKYANAQIAPNVAIRNIFDYVLQPSAKITR